MVSGGSESVRSADSEPQARPGRPARAGRGTRRTVELSLALAGAVVFGLGVYLGLGFAGLLEVASAAPLVLVGAIVAVVFALIYVRGLLRHHFAALERLRGAVVTWVGDPNAVIPLVNAEQAGPEVVRLHGALAALSGREAQDRAIPDRRMQAVLATIREGILVVTEQGQVSLVNFPAKELLGARRVKVGTSAFAAFKRDSLVAAMAEASRASAPRDVRLDTVEGRSLEARIVGLGEHGGAVISFAAGIMEHRFEVEFDLDLHDLPPPPAPITQATPLDELPVLVLDCETTGLDVENDRIISIGAVRLNGTRIYRSLSFDRLINPERPIPPRSTAVHGITDAMVADSSRFPDVFADLAPLLDGTVIVGHNIPYDLAMLRRECKLAGIEWQAPPYLDTLVLVAVLDPQLLDLDLDGLAERFGVDVRGRHTALGDSLVTAEIYARLLPQLVDRHVVTYGDARDFSQRAKDILRLQKRSGW